MQSGDDGQRGDEARFGALMTDVMTSYGRTIDRGQIELFYNVLIDYPFEAVAEAFYLHMGDPDKGQYPPKPADVVRHIQGGKGTQALSAWDKALKAIRETGYYQTVQFDDPLIHAVIDRMGGWPQFCLMEEGGKDFKQRQFIERYTAYMTHPPTDIPKSLPGQHETMNRFLGWEGDPRADFAKLPALIGERVSRPMLPARAKALPREETPADDRPCPKPITGMATLGAVMRSAKTELREPTQGERADMERRKQAMKQRAEVGR